jgi:predicted phage terminase large subunit-like protein
MVDLEENLTKYPAFEVLQQRLSLLSPEDRQAWHAGLSPEQRQQIVEIHDSGMKRACEESIVHLDGTTTEPFYEFVKQAFPYITQDTTWADNWHYPILCKDLQDIVQRVIDGLPNEHDYFVNLPPRLYKSKIVSVCLNAWAWILKPSLQFFICSRNIELCNQHASDTRTLIESKWYQRNWGDRYRLNSDAECSYGNDKGGERWKVAPNSTKGVGFGCNIMVYDDIDDPEQVYRQVEREAVLRLVNEKMSRSRFNDPKTGARIFLQQRCHVDDVSGWHYKNQVYPVKKLVLPAEDSPEVFPPYLREHYRANGGLLFPARLDASVLASQRAILRNSYSGQYGQNPIPTTGNIFNESWVKWFTPSEGVPRFEIIVISADTAQTFTKDSCPCSIQSWGKEAGKPNYYLLADDTEIMSILTTEKRIGAMAAHYPGCAIVIEYAASGFAVLEVLKSKYPLVFPFSPQKYGGKEKRAEAVSRYFESGNVFIPDNSYYRSTWLPEILAFPRGTYADRCDAMSQAILWLTTDARALNSGGPVNVDGWVP